MSEKRIKRTQINIRLSDEEIDRLEALRDRMQATLPIPIKLAVADVIRAGIAELEKQYPPDAGGKAKK